MCHRRYVLADRNSEYSPSFILNIGNWNADFCVLTKYNVDVTVSSFLCILMVWLPYHQCTAFYFCTVRTTLQQLHVTNALCLILLNVTRDAPSSIRLNCNYCLNFQLPFLSSKSVKSECFLLGRTRDHVTSWSNTHEAWSSCKTILLVSSDKHQFKTFSYYFYFLDNQCCYFGNLQSTD